MTFGAQRTKDPVLPPFQFQSHVAAGHRRSPPSELKVATAADVLTSVLGAAGRYRR